MRNRAATSGSRAKRYANRYPWSLLFRMKRFTLRKGQDYKYLTHSMAQMVRNAASPRRHNKRVSIRIAEDGNSLTVEVKR